jgi:hypothetical protein
LKTTGYDLIVITNLLLFLFQIKKSLLPARKVRKTKFPNLEFGHKWGEIPKKTCKTIILALRGGRGGGGGGVKLHQSKPRLDAQNIPLVLVIPKPSL